MHIYIYIYKHLQRKKQAHKHTSICAYTRVDVTLVQMVTFPLYFLYSMTIHVQTHIHALAHLQVQLKAIGIVSLTLLLCACMHACMHACTYV
jgi:hypothetical protein